MKQQRFEDAQSWLHFIFDPTSNETPDPAHPHWHNWKFLPFRLNEHPKSITELLRQLIDPNVASETNNPFAASIRIWKTKLRPHVIARMRISAYQWRTLFTYLDNLIAWGDQLFARDTRESVNEATQLYVMAAKLVGRRPHALKKQSSQPVHTYRSLLKSLQDEFLDAWDLMTGECRRIADKAHMATIPRRICWIFWFIPISAFRLTTNS